MGTFLIVRDVSAVQANLTGKHAGPMAAVPCATMSPFHPRLLLPPVSCGLAQASAELEDASAAYRATDARVTSEQALLLEELAEAKSPFLH